MIFVVLMGAPGAGKGTQAKLLQESLGLPQVSTGDLFRYNLQNDTELGKLARTYMDRGDLVPDDVTVAMVRDRLSQPDAARGAIMDGFPRTVEQVTAFDALLAEVDGEVVAVPYIKVEANELLRRLMKRSEVESRVDDNEETVRKRMQVYEEQTEPLLDHYRQLGLLIEIDGQQSIEAVQKDLKDAVVAVS